MQSNRRRIKYIKRKRQVQRQIIMLSWLLLFMVAILVSCYARKTRTQSEARQVVQAEKPAGKTKKIDVDIETPEEQAERVKAEAVQKGYPEDLIEMVEKNSDTVNFVDHYSEKKDLPAAEDIGDVLEGGWKIPQLYQWDERWGYSTYGTSIIAVSGCGPTCMAMVASGLTNDSSITPAKVGEYSMANGYVDENNNTYWRFMKEAAANWNLSCYDAQLTEEQVKEELLDGHPIICSMAPGDFTDNGHFIVLTGYEDGSVKVNDPFRRKNSEKMWVFADIADQIRAMWIYSVD